MQSQLQTIVDSSVDTLFENTNNPYYKGHPVDLRGYNNVHKYIDIYGAILGGFLFAALQTVGAIWFSVPAYKDVFAFAAVIMLMAWKPTGLIAEKSAERV